MLIINTTGKAKRLEDGVGVFSDIAPDVVVHPLHDFAGFCVDNDSWAAQVVADNPVGVTAFDHIGRHIYLLTIDKPGDNLAVAIQLGDGVQLVPIQEALGQAAIDLFADPAFCPSIT